MTRPATLAVILDAMLAQATGRDPVLLSARTTINRRDFGMTVYWVVVGKTVTITIDARLIPG